MCRNLRMQYVNNVCNSLFCNLQRFVISHQCKDLQTRLRYSHKAFSESEIHDGFNIEEERESFSSRANANYV